MNYPVHKNEVPIMFAFMLTCFIIVLISYIYIYDELTPTLKMWCFAELINSAFLIPYNLVIARVMMKSISGN